MNDCKQNAPLLSRVAEGEAAPDEAMRAARHLSDCTACRISLARDRRLAAMLEDGLEDSLPVGEEFVRSVMDNLPREPSHPRRTKPRRHLKLASLAGFLALAPLLAIRGLGGGSFNLPEVDLLPDVQGASNFVDGLLRVGGLVGLAMRSLASGLPALPSISFPDVVLAAVIGPLLIIALTCAASAFTLAARTLIKDRF
jgi:anti-sigma factor RsiW